MEPFIGTIMRFGGNFAPRGWMFCEGQLLSIDEYTALFSILSNTYGGDARTNFSLPNFKTEEDQDPISKNGFGRHIIAVEGMYPSRR